MNEISKVDSSGYYPVRPASRESNAESSEAEELLDIKYGMPNYRKPFWYRNRNFIILQAILIGLYSFVMYIFMTQFPSICMRGQPYSLSPGSVAVSWETQEIAQEQVYPDGSPFVGTPNHALDRAWHELGWR